MEIYHCNELFLLKNSLNLTMMAKAMLYVLTKLAIPGYS